MKHGAAFAVERVSERYSRSQIAVTVEVGLKFMPDTGKETGAGEPLFHLEKPNIIVLLGYNERIASIKRVEERLFRLIGRQGTKREVVWLERILGVPISDWRQSRVESGQR